MKYIIDDDHHGKSKRRLKKDKENHFYALWKKMDPTPSTEHNELMEEYYRRVSYSNENFDGWKDGWETDRGMIYIFSVLRIKSNVQTLPWQIQLFIKYGLITK